VNDETVENKIAPVKIKQMLINKLLAASAITISLALPFQIGLKM